MFRLSCGLIFLMALHSLSSQPYEDTNKINLNQINTTFSGNSEFNLREELPSIKELVCQLCKYIMSNDTSEEEFYKNKNEILDTSNHHTRFDQNIYQRHKEKEYVKSCQALLGNSICNDIQEPTNAKEDVNVSSDDIKVLRAFQDILVHRLDIKNSYDLGKSHKQYHHLKHRRKRFLKKPILRPDDKDGTAKCNTCDDDLGYCDMFNLVTYIICGFPRILWDNFLGGTVCTFVFTPISLRCFIYSWDCYQAECGFFNF